MTTILSHCNFFKRNNIEVGFEKCKAYLKGIPRGITSKRQDRKFHFPYDNDILVDYFRAHAAEKFSKLMFVIQ